MQESGAFLSFLKNRVNLFYVLALIPLVLVSYFNMFGAIIPTFGFILLLMKKEELVFRIFAEAEKNLEELRGSQAYMSMISKLIEAGVASISGDAIIEFGEKDNSLFTSEAISLIESRVEKSLGEDFHLQFRCAGNEISAGVIVRSKNGRVIIDNSFSGRLERLKEELRGKVSEMLLQE